MSKRILVLCVCVAMIVCFTACKSQKSEGTSSADTTVTAQVGEKQTTKEQTDSQIKKTESETTKQTESKKSEKKAENKEKSTVPTKKNSDGTFNYKGVKTDVIKYSGASLADGKELIDNLVDGVMKDAEIIEQSQSDNSVICVLSAKNSKTNKTQYYKLQYIQDGSVGYLITFRADTQNALNQDLTYVTENYKELAR